MVPPSEADRAQADAYCGELHLRIAQIDDQTIRLRAEMSKYLEAGRTPRVRRVQGGLRSLAVERRKLIDMLIAAGHNHPCAHDLERP